MTNSVEAMAELTHQYEEREAGIIDLLDLYESIEAIYSAAAEASSETPLATTSNSTNRE